MLFRSRIPPVLSMEKFIFPISSALTHMAPFAVLLFESPSPAAIGSEVLLVEFTTPLVGEVLLLVWLFELLLLVLELF